MKFTYRSSSYFYIFIMLCSTFLLSNCDDDKGPSPETFLQRINGTVWDGPENSLGEMTHHYKFNDNVKAIAQIWTRKDYKDSDCFEYSTEGPFKIIEHTSDKLVLDDSYEEEGVLYEDYATLTLENDKIKVVRFVDLDDDFDTMFWEKSSVDTNTLKLCN